MYQFVASLIILTIGTFNCNAFVSIGFSLPIFRNLKCSQMYGTSTDARTAQGDTLPAQAFYSRKSFSDLGFPKHIIDVAKSLSIATPSKIQAIAAFGIETGKPCIIADQTGSGKTLAYLLPVLKRMLANKTKLKMRSPYLVVMTPTTELAIQVSKVVKTLANALKFRTACFTSLSDQDSERKKLRLGADVLVSTPGKLLQLIEKQEVDLSELGVMVLDEADVLLMDESFPLQPIGQACNTGEQLCSEGLQPATQFLFVTATLPEMVVKQIEAEFPDTMTLRGPGLHRVAPSVIETLVDCSGPGLQARGIAQVYANKRKALVTALETSDAQRTVVFCNTIDQCRRVENALQRKDRQAAARHVLCYHSAIEATTREVNLVEFCRSKLNQPTVLVCTDRASRGMDFQSAPVDHVILFDFPQEPSEYLRRVGRTGRAGRQGRVTVLAYGKQLPVARAVMRASGKGERIRPSDNL